MYEKYSDKFIYINIVLDISKKLLLEVPIKKYNLLHENFNSLPPISFNYIGHVTITKVL